MTNREKAIADFTKYLDTLDVEELADIINEDCRIGVRCKYCIYNCGTGVCGTRTDICLNGIRKWLKQEEKSNE